MGGFPGLRVPGVVPTSRLSNQERDLQMKTTAFALIALLGTSLAVPALAEGPSWSISPFKVSGPREFAITIL